MKQTEGVRLEEEQFYETAPDGLILPLAARRAGIPAELHIFKNGGHGFGLGEYLPLVREWKKLCENWLETV